MTYRMAAIGVFAGLTAWAAQPQTKREQPTAEAKEGVIDPKADAQLKHMSEYMAGMQSFRVDTTTVDEKVATDGQKIQALQESRLAVRRPNGLMVDRTGPNGHAMFRYDGKQFSIYLPDKREYATAPAPKDLDAAIESARERLHIDAPGGDLLVADPYRDLTEGIVTARYIGREPVGNVMAHHLAVSEKDVDWQIWIQEGAQPLPLRYVITTKDLPGKPQFTMEFRNWEPDAAVPADVFSFTPPPGARRIEFAPVRKAER